MNHVDAHDDAISADLERRIAGSSLIEEGGELSKSLRAYIRAAWHIIQPEVPFIDNWHIGAMCELLEEITAERLRKLMIWVPPGSMKPVDEEVFVLMGDGTRKRLAEVEAGDTVISHRGVPRAVLAVYEQGLLPTLSIRTHSGREVRAAHDHPFLTTEGWKEASELCSGDVLATVARPQTYSLDGELPAAYFRLMGYIVGDGNTSGNAANISCWDPQQGADIAACVEAVGFRAAFAPHIGRYNLSGGIRPWLREAGLADRTSHTKRVPAAVFAAPEPLIAEFIGAYFACDGTLTKREEKRSDLTVSFSSVNRALLEDVQHLLLRLGVRSRIRVHKGSGFRGPDYISWVLVITSLDDTSKFISRIPVIGQKAERLARHGIRRSRFDELLQPDTIVEISDGGPRICRCLRVAEDSTFTANDLVVHNTITTSIAWPTWEWTTRPNLRYMTCSYDMDIAIETGAVPARDLILSSWYQDRWSHVYALKVDLNKKASYANNRGGARFCAAPNAKKITGRHVHRMLLDDPNDAASAEGYSDDELEKINKWHDGTLPTRFADPKKSVEVVIQQRLHERDLSGHLQDGGWHVLCLPERYDPKHPFVWPDDTREPEELLWSQRIGEAENAERRKTLGAHRAAGQLQQEPSAREGDLLKRAYWRYFPEEAIWLAEEGDVSRLPTFRMIVCSWDTSFKDKTTNDPAAGGVWGILGGDRYLLKVRYERMALSATKTAMLEMREWAMERWPNAIHYTLVEKRSNGVEIIAQMKRIVPGLVAYNPGNLDKTQRAENAEPDLESGNVFICGASNGEMTDYDPTVTPAWAQEVIEQCTKFPRGRNDDLVDMTTQTLNWVRARAQTRSRVFSPADYRLPALEGIPTGMTSTLRP